MDRTMYGKVDHGARQPYRIILSKGIEPGCKYSNLILMFKKKNAKSSNEKKIFKFEEKQKFIEL